MQFDDYNAVAPLYLNASVDAKSKPTARLRFRPAMRNATIALPDGGFANCRSPKQIFKKAVDPASQE
jgi:hypothetical protein